MNAWAVLDSDRELFDRELDSFVPTRIFDAHCHLYEKKHFSSEPPPLVSRGPDCAGLAVYWHHMGEMMPGRSHSALCFPYPHAQLDFTPANEFVASEVRRDPCSRGQMIIRPEMDPEFIRETVRRERFAGLKCYHVYAKEQPTFQAPIPSYLPEEQVRIAHEEGLTITLHMVRSRALADPFNQEVIRRYAERYPDARLILAHAARGFNPHHTAEGIEHLRDLSNVWFDTSAVTDAGAFEAILSHFGAGRLLYGSDFPVSQLRGRCIALNDSFLWITEDNTSFAADYAEVRPALVALESLRILKLACRTLRLSDNDVEAIFFENACKLYSLNS